MNRHNLILVLALAAGICAGASALTRERTSIDNGWKFAFGNASSPEKDFGAGTEYFTYLTKAASIHNTGPYAMDFNDSTWTAVNLPHDFVVDLPFDSVASHSHGYKTVGYKYPETSVGWYRKELTIPAADSLSRFAVAFDGIFRDSKVWFNGFYLGGEPSGYTSAAYDITPYINFGGRNVLTVRSDATIEEGWFYEGGGIYRHAWLEKTPQVSIGRNSIAITADFAGYKAGDALPLKVTAEAVNRSLENSGELRLEITVDDKDGKTAAAAEGRDEISLRPGTEGELTANVDVADPQLWSPEKPTLYDVTVKIVKAASGETVDAVTVRTGFRDIRFDADKGLSINGKNVKLKGVNMHQDHAGTGAAIPDALNVYRLKELKKYGVNAYRASHNPMTPEVLDACDSLGILVIEENRLLGTNGEHLRQIRAMIDRDRNHPSVMLWSVGNEEWGVEWNDHGTRIVEELVPLVNAIDSTRPVTVATSGGPSVIIPAQVAGYNYIMQNPVDEYRTTYPERRAYGSEETSGAGTRGVYFTDPAQPGHMPSLNRKPDDKDGTLNRIERGWKFYAERPWLSGLFYWTGLDYRGEPNPLKYPATGSEFGILDYAGFPKDEAYYLKSWWTDEPVLHILPHWNLEGHEGETVPVWVYSNMDEVELTVNGKNLGRKKMPENGHLSWDAEYQPGRVTAKGYKNGHQITSATVETAAQPVMMRAESNRPVAGDTFRVINVSLRDKKGRFVPTACNEVTITLSDGTIVGAGNGDPAFRGTERPLPGDAARSFTMPAFNGLVQFLVNIPEGAEVTITSPGLKTATAR